MHVLVIGHGIAGASVAWELAQQGVRVVVAASSSRPSATRKAAGLINPVVLKRLKKVWYSEESLRALDFYEKVAAHLGVNEPFIRPIAMQQRFSEISYSNDWSILESDPSWSRDLGEASAGTTWSGLRTPFGSAPLKRVWMVDTNRLLDTLESWHRSRLTWREGTLNNNDLFHDDGRWVYGDERFDAVVWANGMEMLESTYWKNLPIRPNFGTWIQLPQPSDVAMSSEQGFHSEFFLLPKWVDGVQVLQIGSTYSPNQAEAPQNNVDRLVKYLQSLRIDPGAIVDVECIKRVDGVRPTSADRRPMYGAHPQFSGAYCAGALGSRGLLHAPVLARALTQMIIQNADVIPEEANVRRFNRRLQDRT